MTTEHHNSNDIPVRFLWECARPENQKLVDLYEKTWNRIKASSRGLEDTATLTRYWKKSGIGENLVSLLYNWGRRQEGTNGESFLEGTLLVIWAPCFQLMLKTEGGEDAACSLIAHELAHAFQYASGWFDGRRDHQSEEEKRAVDEEAEKHAKEIEMAWEFSPETREIWKLNNRAKLLRIDPNGIYCQYT